MSQDLSYWACWISVGSYSWGQSWVSKVELIKFLLCVWYNLFLACLFKSYSICISELKNKHPLYFLQKLLSVRVLHRDRRVPAVWSGLWDGQVWGEHLCAGKEAFHTWGAQKNKHSMCLCMSLRCVTMTLWNGFQLTWLLTPWNLLHRGLFHGCLNTSLERTRLVCMCVHVFSFSFIYCMYKLLLYKLLLKVVIM